MLVVKQMHLDARVDVMARHKYRVQRLASLRTFIADSNSVSTYPNQWRRSVVRAYRQFLVASASAGVPCRIAGRSTRLLAVVKVGAIYRAYSCASRVQSRLLQQRLRDSAADAKTQRGYVVELQQCARAWLAQYHARRKYLNHSSITIQRFARGKLGRRRIYHIRKKLAAVISIQATARKAAATKTYHPQLRWLQQLKVPTSILQSQVRRLKSIVLATKLREAVVFDNEKILRAHKNLCYCRQIVRTELCIESYRGRAKYRGEFQAIFAKYCRKISTSKQSFLTHPCIKLLGVHPAVELTSSKRQMQPRAISQDITVRGRTLTEDNSQLVQQAHCYGAKMSASEFTRLFKDTSGAVVGFSRPSAKERSYNGIKTSDLEVIFAREKRHGEKCITFDIFLALSIV